MIIPLVNTRQKAVRRRFSAKHKMAVALLLILSLFLTTTVTAFVFLPDRTDTIASDHLYESGEDKLVLNPKGHPYHYVYVDVGCFKGETVEHFIYFNSNSTLYDIITFEPDPDNYRLCRRALKQKKYAHLNIMILHKVAWIRDGPVLFQTEHGSESRIAGNGTSNARSTHQSASGSAFAAFFLADDGSVRELDGIDFSAWLARLFHAKNVKLYIKLSMYGAEVTLLEKMIIDGTMGLADRFEIEWSDRKSPYTRPRRIYAQLMLDSFGFDGLYSTRLKEARKVFQTKAKYENVTKHYDWQIIEESDTYTHYLKRPDMAPRSPSFTF